LASRHQVGIVAPIEGGIEDKSAWTKEGSRLEVRAHDVLAAASSRIETVHLLGTEVDAILGWEWLWLRLWHRLLNGLHWLWWWSERIALVHRDLELALLE
jgi:hypothetical protein